MGEYLSPGVYVEEKSSGTKPIAGVGTSTGAFVGIAEKGPIGDARLITNWTQFVNTFGTFIPDGYLAYGVYHFFNEGGSKCYVVRTCHYTGTAKDAVASAGTLMDGDTPTPGKCLRVTASSDGKWGDKIKIEAKAATDSGFKLLIKYTNAKNEDVVMETYDNLTLLTVEDTLNAKSDYVRVEKDGWNEGSTAVTGSGKIPKLDQTVTLAGGNDGIQASGGGSSLTASDFLGDENALSGLHAFDPVDDINIVAIPDMAGDVAVIKGAYTYCENRKDCFFVADAPWGKTPTGASTGVLEFKKNNSLKSSYGALYYPWIQVSDPLKGKKFVPPSGAVAGIYSRTDIARGVHKAPAGVSDGYVRSALALERVLTKGEHDALNNPGINVIRFFPDAGICVWGARTLSDDPEWKYINIRRLFLFLEESIDEGTQWVVFEPNDPKLWGSVKRNITAFLLRVWRDGALFGNSADEAFFVKVDEENNPPEVRDAGQLIIEIGVAPVKPAEFVIIRISQKTLTK